MKSEIKVFPYPNGDIQRVHLVRWEDWSRLDFLQLNRSDRAMDCFARIYRQFLVPKQPWIFGNLIMFRLPKDLKAEVSFSSGRYGDLCDKLTAAAAALQKGVKIHRGNPVFLNTEAKYLWNELVEKNCLQVISGKLPVTTIIPVGDTPGFLTETEPDAAVKVNASFFIMDRFDCATIYDHIGIPLGLCVKNGVVENPPLFCREALLVRKDGSTAIEQPDIRKMQVEIRGKCYRHGENATVYTRPDRIRTPGKKDVKLVIIGCRVEAVYCGGSVPIPASGFVLCPEGPCDVQPGDAVAYRGMEDVLFGMQVGNSIVRNGEKTKNFISRFYNIRHPWTNPFPPSLYPLDFDHARAARIALGADADGKPMLLWAEGAAKLGYVQGKSSCGASLAEMANICSELGMVNAINLDGGGSAQLLCGNRRELQISDRKKEDHSEAERPVPLGLVVR